MTQEEIRHYLCRNKSYISYSAIANKISMDVSNFHKFVKGDLKLKPEKLPEIQEIIISLSGS